ncbi:nectin cell adhesion molecule 1a isoform X1 [Takifugu flavidus]|uniref:Nectin-1 Herpes virus entry mediator C n=1 Tax=Takifugu flavidus TaxID=433684 RepID=A0A5C6P4P0_9TELE|nr:nectin cell adhesion molecule 1a isoform X1 [Takifugu flavidus]TWW74712.1 Nectin-1 Herpes virus entry mediator C [Takifugu flavidus]
MENIRFWIILAATCVVPGINGQTVDMDDGKSGFVGSKVDLRCRFINSSPPVKISQVTWQKLVNGSKQNVAIANPSLGVSVAPPYRDRVAFKNGAVRRRTPNLEDTTISFSSLRLSDEATYICEYTTFPAGNRENTVNLTVYVRPTTQMSLSTPTLVARSSNLKMPVATCVSANGKPPAALRWETSVPGEATTREYRNSDGTFTVQSDYVLVPSRETHKETLTCVTTYNEEVFTDSVTLDIQYEPDVSVDGFDGNWYLNRENVQLSCQADANPTVSLYQWRLINGSIPSNAEIRDNVLIFKGPLTYDLQGTYVCDATNSIGTRSASVEVSVIEKPLPQIATGDVISVIALLLAAGVLMGITITVLVLKIRSRNKQSSRDSPSKKLPQPIRKRPGDDIQHSGRFYEELPNTADYVSYRLACNKDDYPEPYSPPINPPLSFLPQHPYHSQPPTATGSSTTTTTSSKNTYSPPSHTTAVFKYPSVQGLSSPPPGVAAYTFPKEQYV